ncbi:MAG TPA: hypothetical protein VHE55_11345 [Fimbriimonadaceae bacterium]|nr:hypothetical protein [Fimbriimonadaceae bacterium]
MALRAVIEHPKFKRLKVLLGLNMREALGTLEGLWHFCARYTPQGDVGKYPDREIESWLEWPGEPGALIGALVEARWLDVHPEHRLIVHDWYDHADDTVHSELAKRTLFFVTGQTPRLSKRLFNGDTRARINAEYKASQKKLALDEPGDSVPPIPEPEPEPAPEPTTPFRSPENVSIRGEYASLLDHLPPDCRSEELEETWLEFQEHRRGLPHASPYRPAACRHLARKLVERRFRPPDIVRLIRHCIASGWKGVPLDFVERFELSPPTDGLRGGLTEEQIVESLR